MAKVITGIQWGEKCIEMDIEDSRIKTKAAAFGDEDRIGIIKAYTTRSGKGGFPTELFGEAGTKLYKLGKEYDSATGMPRRCGWLDIVLVKDAISKYKLTSLVIEKINTIGRIGYITPIQLCRLYQYQHFLIKTVPDDIENCRPIYETFYGGWDVGNCKSWQELDDRAKRYIEHIEKYVQIPVRYIGIGSKIIPKPQK